MLLRPESDYTQVQKLPIFSADIRAEGVCDEPKECLRTRLGYKQVVNESYIIAIVPNQSACYYFVSIKKVQFII